MKKIITSLLLCFTASASILVCTNNVEKRGKIPVTDIHVVLKRGAISVALAGINVFLVCGDLDKHMFTGTFPLSPTQCVAVIIGSYCIKELMNIRKLVK